MKDEVLLSGELLQWLFSKNYVIAPQEGDAILVVCGILTMDQVKEIEYHMNEEGYELEFVVSTLQHYHPQVGLLFNRPQEEETSNG